MKTIYTSEALGKHISKTQYVARLKRLQNESDTYIANVYYNDDADTLEAELLQDYLSNGEN